MNNHVTVLEIDKNAVLHNLNFFKNRLKPETKVCAVVKAISYGSDAVEIAKIIENHIDYFAVAYTDEGIELRNAGIKTPILVLYPQIQNIKLITEYFLEPSLYNYDILDAFFNYTNEYQIVNYPIHIKFNTGLNRLGFSKDDIPTLISKIKASNNSKNITSIFSHLGASEDHNEIDFTRRQINTFKNIISDFTEALGYKPLIHTLNTSGVINYADAQFDMVRIGIGLYGFGNEDNITKQLKNTHNLTSTICQIHKVKTGESVGYNKGFIADKDTLVAVVPIGHADGIPRCLGHHKGSIIINDKTASIIGNVCMDIILVDVTNINCKVGDKVIIFNHQDHINNLAEKSNTISYEILTGISRRIKRIVI